MSQSIDLLDDFSEALVVSSAPAASPWSIAATSLEEPSQSESNTNVNASSEQSMPVLRSTQPSTALVTINNNRDASSSYVHALNDNNNKLIPYVGGSKANSNGNDNKLEGEGPLSTRDNDIKLSQMTNIISKHVPPNASPLPFLPVHASGYVLCRISFRTLLFKKWKQCYYLLYGTTKLLVFRSKEDADDWRFNPYHTKNERDFLVRLCIDFLNDCKIIQNCRGYKISPMGHKSYGRRKEDLLYHFKLERCMDYGPVIASCFASQDKTEIDTIRKLIIHCIKYSLNELKLINNNNTANNNLHNINQSISIPTSPPPPIRFSSSYHHNPLQQQNQLQPFGYNDDYVFDYDSGKPIPVSQFQTKPHSALPKNTATTNDHNDVSMIARGRYSQN